MRITRERKKENFYLEDSDVLAPLIRVNSIFARSILTSVTASYYIVYTIR